MCWTLYVLDPPTSVLAGFFLKHEFEGHYIIGTPFLKPLGRFFFSLFLFALPTAHIMTGCRVTIGLCIVQTLGLESCLLVHVRDERFVFFSGNGLYCQERGFEVYEETRGEDWVTLYQEKSRTNAWDTLGMVVSVGI
jgi:hypothetical protein